MTPEVSEWIAKAEGDFATATGIWDFSTPVYDTICYHYQQCLEKYLKGVLLQYEETVPRIHDLQKLGRSMTHHIPEFQVHLEDLERLTNLALEVRYPGFSALKEDALDSKTICETIRELCLKHLP